MPPVNPANDPDFKSANPSDQMAHLRSTDSDFASASPKDQMDYLMQVRGPSVQSPMSVPSVPRPQLPGDMAPTALEQAGVNMNFCAKGDLPFFSAKDPKNAAALQNAYQFNDVTSRDLG